jgi:hypothetical protein
VIVANFILLVNGKAGMRPTRVVINEQIIEYDSHSHTRDDISAVLDVGNHRITRTADFWQMHYARCAMDNNIQKIINAPSCDEG